MDWKKKKWTVGKSQIKRKIWISIIDNRQEIIGQKKLKIKYIPTFWDKIFQEYTEGSNNVGNLTFSGNFKATQIE